MVYKERRVTSTWTDEEKQTFCEKSVILSSVISINCTGHISWPAYICVH